jgi:hypothetical protein
MMRRTGLLAVGAVLVALLATQLVPWAAAATD